MKNNEEKKKIKHLEHVMIEGAATETVMRTGAAAKQHYIAYSGIDNETGQTLTKGLKTISQSKVHPDYASQNIKQQAGFSAEVKSVSRKNADRIVHKNYIRVSRTDDLGKINDPLYDIVEINSSNEALINSGTQMKFVGSSPDKLLSKLNSKKYQKYIDADVKFSIADDDYNALMGISGQQGIIDTKIQNLEQQVSHAEKTEQNTLAAKKREQIEKYKKIKNNLQKSGLTRDEAIEARLHPRLSTAKDIARLGHQAGIAQTRNGLIISGSVSLVQNIVDCANGNCTPEEAALSVLGHAVVGAGTSYVTAFSGTVIKGAMQNSSSQYVRNISKTNFASSLVTTTIDIGKIMHSYITGKINGLQCIESLGERGIGEIGSAMFATIGVASVSGVATTTMIPVIAGIAGATFGYAASISCYQELSVALKEASLAREERIRIEKECTEAIFLIRHYREEMNALVSQYFVNHIATFNFGFSAMDTAIKNNDINGFIRGNNEIQSILGKEILFTSQDEFDDLMSSDSVFKL